MSDAHMILTIERMQIELRRAMEDIQYLSLELQKRNQAVVEPMAIVEPMAMPVAMPEPMPVPESVKKTRKIKVKKAIIEPTDALNTSTDSDTVTKKPTAIAPWNAYVSLMRATMQSETEVKPRQEDVLAKAKASKDADPEGYKAFCVNWLAAQP